MLENTKKKFWIGVIILGIIVFYAFRNSSHYVRATSFVLAFVAIPLIDYMFNLKFKIIHYLILIVVIFSGIMMSPLYFTNPNYDKILHLANPILISVIVFFLINKLDLKPFQKILLTFCVVVSSLALFEIGEYYLDIFFDTKLQGVYLWDTEIKNKLNLIQPKNDDTMIDMSLGILGCIIFLVGKTTTDYYKKLKGKH